MKFNGKEDVDASLKYEIFEIITKESRFRSSGKISIRQLTDAINEFIGKLISIDADSP